MARCSTSSGQYSGRMIRPRPSLCVVASTAVVTVVLVLGGCAPETAAPVATTTSGRSQSPTSTPVAVTLASIQLSGTALTLIGSDRSMLKQLSYSGDPVLAIAALTKESGETPTLETLVATNCSFTNKRASWGDGLTLTYNTKTVDGAPAFVVRSDSPKTPGGVVVTTASGFGVGDPISSLIAATPGVVVDGQDTVDQYGLSAYFDLDSAEIGAVAISDAKSGLIRLLNAPVGRSQDC